MLHYLNPTMLDKVKAAAKKLCEPNNTVTTLEIKLYLREEAKKAGVYEHWIQDDVSGAMRQFSDDEGLFDYCDNGHHRTYSLAGVQPYGSGYYNNYLGVATSQNALPPAQPAYASYTNVASTPAKVKKPRPVRPNQTFNVDRDKALDLIKNSKGMIFSVKNTAYKLSAFDTPKGHLTLLEVNAGLSQRVLNMQAVTDLKIGGNNYIIQ